MNAQIKSASVAIGCSFLGAVSTAFGGVDADAHFKKMDADGDGKISRAEHTAASKQMFAACDANHDGIVTAAEMDASMAKQGEKLAKDDKNSAERIAMIDQNGDGKLSVAEHEAGTEKMFAMADKNSDGFLSKAECEEGLKAMKKDK